MHVDAKLFMWLTASERFYTLLPVDERFELGKCCPMVWEQQLIDSIAEKIHNDYYRQRIVNRQDTPNAVPWAELIPDKKRSNIDAAIDIPVKLGLIGHGIRKIKGDEAIQTPDISDDEIEKLAIEEHERWCREQLMQGWKYGTTYEKVLKIHNNLVGWVCLTEDDKNKRPRSHPGDPAHHQRVGVMRLLAYGL